MAKYRVFTKVESNIPVTELYYDLSVYRIDNNNIKHILLACTHQAFEAGYLTKSHETNETNDELSVVYLMEIMLYRQHGGKLLPALSTPSRKIFTLGEIVFGLAYSQTKRENVCYFETHAQTRPVSHTGQPNIHSIQITCQERIFVAREHPVGDPLDPFTKEKVEGELDTRKAASFLNPEGQYYPDQYYTMLCGPAAYFYCLMIDRFDIYEVFIWNLWSYGKAKLGSMNIIPHEKTKKNEDLFGGFTFPRISAIDWISMASLRDSSNKLLDYESVSNKVSAITLWDDIERWMISLGSKKIFSNISLKHSEINDICKLNSFINGNVHVISLISAGMLQKGADVPFKDHWIVWDGKLKLLNGDDITLSTDKKELVSLRLFSWGTVKDNGLRAGLTLEDFSHYLFGGMVFTKIP